MYVLHKDVLRLKEVTLPDKKLKRLKKQILHQLEVSELIIDLW